MHSVESIEQSYFQILPIESLSTEPLKKLLKIMIIYSLDVIGFTLIIESKKYQLLFQKLPAQNH